MKSQLKRLLNYAFHKKRWMDAQIQDKPHNTISAGWLTVCWQQGLKETGNSPLESNAIKCVSLVRLSTDFREVFDISIFASVRLGFPCKIQMYNNLLLYIHNKTPNVLLFNSGAKILCSVKYVRKPDAQAHSICATSPLRLIKGNKKPKLRTRARVRARTNSMIKEPQQKDKFTKIFPISSKLHRMKRSKICS